MAFNTEPVDAGVDLQPIPAYLLIEPLEIIRGFGDLVSHSEIV